MKITICGLWREPEHNWFVTGDNQLLPIDQHSGAGDTGQLSHRNSAPGRLAKVISLSYASTKLSIDFV